MEIKRMTPAEVEAAQKLFNNGWSPKRISEKLGFTSQSVRRAVDKAYAEKRKAQINAARKARYEPVADFPAFRSPETAGLRQDISARLAEIPPDTRTPAQRMMGDPIPNDPRRYWRKEGL